MRWKDLFISHAFFVYLLGFGTDKVARKFFNIKRNLENSSRPKGVVGWCEGAVYLTSLGRPTDIGLQLGKACYPCSG